LDNVEVKDGGLAVICDLPVQSQAELFEDIAADLGEEALASFVKGIETITFDLRTRKGRWVSRYTREVHTHVVSRIQEPIENRGTIEGRLLMGDFKETGVTHCLSVR
jgi:hypothetical protein